MKIALIGGGSLEWTPTLVTDLAVTPEVHGGTLVLHDVEPGGLKLQEKLAAKICRQAGSRIRVEATTNREQALEGADFVIFSIGVGGLDTHQVDLEIPERFGIRQPVGVSVGPGGISRALRHIPATLAVCRDMERLCPSAWLLNLTNPMTQLCWAAGRESSIQTIGLCHGTDGVRRDLAANVFQVGKEDIWIQAAGINHLPWITEMRVNGRDGLPMLSAWLADHGVDAFSRQGLEGSATSVFRDRMAVKFRLFLATGALPGAGDRHVVEFYPHFVRAGTRWGLDYGVELTTIGHRRERKEMQRGQVDSWLSGETEPVLERSREQAAPIIAALTGGPGGRFIVNIPNEGQITNLPAGPVVECFAQIDRHGVQPEAFGPLPEAAAAVCQWHLEEMSLTISAALEGDRQKALEALRMDPSVTTWDSAERLLDEMLAGTADYLPHFI